MCDAYLPTSVLILVFLGLSVLGIGPMYATDKSDVRQTDVRQTSDAHHRLMPPPWRGHNNNNRISIAPYGRNFRGAGGRSDQCSVQVSVNKKVLSLDLKTDREWLMGIVTL